MADVAFGSVLNEAKPSKQAGLTSMRSLVMTRSLPWILRFAQDDKPI